MNHYFSSDQCMMLQNHAWVKDSLKEWDRPINFKVTKCKRIHWKGFDFTWFLSFKILPLVKFWSITFLSYKNGIFLYYSWCFLPCRGTTVSITLVNMLYLLPSIAFPRAVRFYSTLPRIGSALQKREKDLLWSKPAAEWVNFWTLGFGLGSSLVHTYKPHSLMLIMFIIYP